MRKSTVYFERIPVAEVMGLLATSEGDRTGGPKNFACHLCQKPVALATAKTNEEGRAVHEQCYVEWLQKRRGSAVSSRKEPDRRAKALTRV